jgi:hypothetical protein
MATHKDPDNKKNPPIFAYLRRSTTNKQEISIENQADNIDFIIADNGFDKDEVEYFSESKTAYDGVKQKNGKIIRKRIEFTRLLKAIDEAKAPCIILVRESSRLSRNELDSLEIQKKLFGLYGSKKKIEKIIFYDGVIWDEHSDRQKVSQELLNNYHYSIQTGKSSKGGVGAQLRRGHFVYNPPAGLVRVKVGPKAYILSQNEKMPAIRRAFEMKVEWKGHREISRFLRQFGINKGERHLTESIFTLPVYAGWYVDKKTGEIFDKLIYKEWAPPIPRSLWDKTQDVLGKKNSHYGEKQEDHLFEAKMKTESGHLFSKYLAKEWQYPAYKWKYKDDSGKDRFIHIMESKIIASFMRGVWEMISYCSKQHSKELAHAIAYEKEAFLTELHWKEISKWEIERDATRLSSGFCKGYGYEVAISEFSEELRKKFLSETKELRGAKKDQVKKLEDQKQAVEIERKTYRKNAVSMKIEKEELDEITADFDKDIQRLDGLISELSADTEMESYLERIPEILEKTVELASNPLRKAEIERLREDVKKLLEITTVELTITNKKELKIKLFDVLNSLLSSDKSILEASMGVEPISTALQAAV